MKSSDNRDVMPRGEIFDITVPVNSAMAEVEDSSDIYAESGVTPDGLPVPGMPGRRYMPFGHDNRLPFRLMHTVGSDEVLSQNLFFNILTAYGSGLEYVDSVNGGPSQRPDVRRFVLGNSLREFFLEL